MYACAHEAQCTAEGARDACGETRRSSVCSCAWDCEDHSLPITMSESDDVVLGHAWDWGTAGAACGQAQVYFACGDQEAARKALMTIYVGGMEV
mmetsp:Transcript_20133/g.34668  ORF Transcript_20133/g.34668 Transcript_20133/m.34668 type:complete len:94 (-) Transcript_20133:48-329(-)